MDINQYLYDILRKYNPLDRSQYVFTAFHPVIRSWATNYLLQMQLSGSTAKGTAIRGTNDVDYLISLNSNILNSLTLEQIYNSLHSQIQTIPYVRNIRKQRVSIGFNFNGIDIDFTPAVKDSGNSNYHKLYVNEKNKRWVLTNINKHIEYVRNSHRLNEIKLFKIWRKIHGLEFPSIYLETIVIENLKRYSYSSLSDNFVTILEYLSKSFIYDSYFDISNTNNKISDDLTMIEKNLITTKAKQSLSNSWNQVIW